jgi:hypothetical protein
MRFLEYLCPGCDDVQRVNVLDCHTELTLPSVSFVCPGCSVPVLFQLSELSFWTVVVNRTLMLERWHKDVEAVRTPADIGVC